MHYENIDDAVIVPRLEAYDDTLRREGIGDLFRQLPLPIAGTIRISRQ